MKAQFEKGMELAMRMIGCGDMMSFDRTCAIAYHVLQTQNLRGDIGEVGCYQGRTAMLMASLTRKTIHLYDSFEGLPDRQAPDEGSAAWFQRGHLMASPQEVEANFLNAHLPAPKIHVGWFKDLVPHQFPSSFCFVHIDGDFYSSVKDALAQIYWRMVVGGVILIDDYGWPDLPGAKIATDEFFTDKSEKPQQLMGLNGSPATQALVIKDIC